VFGSILSEENCNEEVDERRCDNNYAFEGHDCFRHGKQIVANGGFFRFLLANPVDDVAKNVSAKTYEDGYGRNDEHIFGAFNYEGYCWMHVGSVKVAYHGGNCARDCEGGDDDDYGEDQSACRFLTRFCSPPQIQNVW